LAAERQHRCRLPSLVSAVGRDQALVWFDGRGAPSWDASTPVGELTPDTQFRIGSITKSFTTVAVLQLRDEGRLDLSDTIGRHLRALPADVAALRVDELLSHASGLRREPVGPWWERHEGGDGQALLRDLADPSTALPPGRAFHYSNLAFGLLGQVVEALRQASWWDVVSTRILQPLGMSRTTLLAEPPHATGHSVHPWCDVLAAEPTPNTGAMGAAGQLWSTAEDLLKWGAFIALPEPAVLAAESMTEMTDPHLPTGASSADEQLDERLYALGLVVLIRSGRVVVGHGGSMPGFLAGLVIDRAARVAGISFAGAYSGFAPLAHAADLVSAVVTAEPPLPPAWHPGAPPSEVAELLGDWWWGYDKSAVTARADRPGLLLVTPAGGATVAFRPEGPDRWRGIDGEQIGEIIEVRRGPDKTAAGLTLSTYEWTRQPHARPA
jgi:CubicO group peptidase (beta-lactamase class C family)